MRYVIDVPDDSPFFTTTNEFDGGPERVFIVAFTRGDYKEGTELISDLQAASDNSPSFVSGDFQLATIVDREAECTSDDPTNHQGNTCPVHEGTPDWLEPGGPNRAAILDLVKNGPAVGATGPLYGTPQRRTI